ncbi:cupin-like domain-containing protein [Chitinophaga sp. Hz27]|uniref:cupin-like domain-containing protein n=1 Tax=Chitinophaga sp. Hz27 TaxID=3347169 RepID=UPI0035E086A5
MKQPTIDRIHRPTQEEFRKKYLDLGKPVLITGVNEELEQFKWNFDYLSGNLGEKKINVYDWGGNGPTIEDEFLIKKMELAKALSLCRSVDKTENQRFSICQLALDFLPELYNIYQTPDFLKDSDRLDHLPWLWRERRRIAMFISFFRGMHWHNGRHAIAQQITGSKRFILYDPKDTKYLYPKTFMEEPLSWFDERESVFCSQMPFEQGIENIDLSKFPRFKNATPYEIELKAGEILFIPSHWWHYTHACEPCVLITEFWDASLKDWGYPIAYRSLFMKPYRKFLFNKVVKLKKFSRKEAQPDVY